MDIIARCAPQLMRDAFPSIKLFRRLDLEQDAPRVDAQPTDMLTKRKTLHLAAILFACLAAVTAAHAAPVESGVDRAFARLYNCDFAGAHAVLDEEQLARPDDPLVFAVRAAVYLFAEFDRQRVLELAFFEDDNKVTDRKKLKSDPAVRDRVFRMTAEARRLATVRLATDPKDRNALFAVCMAVGTEMDYVGFIEKRYFRTYVLSRESQKYARRLLALDPPVYDAYLTIGSAEYVVGSLNFFFRLFVRLDQIEGDKQKAVADLERVVQNGRYYRPFAKVLLAALHLRENRPAVALNLLRELDAEFPNNSLVSREIARTEEKIRLSNGSPVGARIHSGSGTRRPITSHTPHTMASNRRPIR